MICFKCTLHFKDHKLGILPVGVAAGLISLAVVGVFRGLHEDLDEPDEDVFLHPAPKKRKHV